MKKRQFEQAVDRALASLPEEFQQLLDNVAIFIEDRPSRSLLRELGMSADETMLGLYEGIPQTERTTSYDLVPPDRITLFQRPIEECCNSDAEVAEQIRRTILHEVGHHFGIDEDRLDEIEAAWAENDE
ncbi:MAG: metallopeptidase family protein [Dehalococcoidia bacterium]|nr:metallopeptidase family protein [Dehalococcoidia bacterium]